MKESRLPARLAMVSRLTDIDSRRMAGSFVFSKSKYFSWLKAPLDLFCTHVSESLFELLLQVEILPTLASGLLVVSTQFGDRLPPVRHPSSLLLVLIRRLCL